MPRHLFDLAKEILFGLAVCCTSLRSCPASDIRHSAGTGKPIWNNVMNRYSSRIGCGLMHELKADLWQAWSHAHIMNIAMPCPSATAGASPERIWKQQCFGNVEWPTSIVCRWQSLQSVLDISTFDAIGHPFGWTASILERLSQNTWGSTFNTTRAWRFCRYCPGGCHQRIHLNFIGIFIAIHIAVTEFKALEMHLNLTEVDLHTKCLRRMEL